MLRVLGFDNRGAGAYPYGFINFSDDRRITYAALLGPNAKPPRDEWGLNPDWEDQGISEVHLRIARKYVDGHLPKPADACPKWEAEQARMEARKAAQNASA